METTAEKKKSRVLAVIIVVIACIVVLHCLSGFNLLSPQNILIMLSSMTLPTLIALGFTFIFACNITDLSPGAIVLITANVAGLTGNAFGIPAMLLITILVGILCGFINFTIYRVSKIPPWIAGLGMTMVYEAIIGAYSATCTQNGATVVNLEDQYRIFGQRPLIYVVLVVCIVIAYIIYNNTTVGVNMRAAGCNENVAKTMGINVSLTIIAGGIIAGAFFGIAGVVKEGYAAFTPAQSGLSSLSTVFQPLAAVLLAKTLSKYVNRIIAVPISTFLITLIFNVLTQFGVPSGTFQEFLLGVVVILFAIIAQRGVKEVVK